MRVLHLDAGREMRGGQWQVLRLMEGLATAGVESTLLARPGAPLYPRCALRFRSSAATDHVRRCCHTRPHHRPKRKAVAIARATTTGLLPRRYGR